MFVFLFGNLVIINLSNCNLDNNKLEYIQNAITSGRKKRNLLLKNNTEKSIEEFIIKNNPNISETGW
jgi:hypothetical protein